VPAELDIGEIAGERYARQLSDIIEEANDDPQQVRFLKRWFAEYRQCEAHAYLKWFKHTQNFALEIEGVTLPTVLNENDEIIAFDMFIATLWSKYHYCAVR
jgi:hypothetical protein